MKKLTTIFSSLTVAAIAALFFSACSSNTVTPPSGSVSSNVAVTSATTTSVTVGWVRDPNDTSADTIFVSGGAVIPAVVVSSSASSGTVNGLTTDVAYSISIGSPVGRTTAITYTIYSIPTNLMVNAMSATSIGAEWTRDANDAGTDTIVAMNGSTVVSTTPTTSSKGIVTGLTEGTAYSISIHIASGATSNITWMTAERTTGIKIYEKADPDAGDPSALVLAANGTGAVSLTGATNADFVLDDDASLPSGISFEAGAVFNSLWNDTRVNPNANYIVGGLNNDYRATDYTQDIIAANDNAYNLPNDASYGTKGSAVLTCQTASGNLALVEIVPDAATGMLYSTTADGYKYVTVNVSYQSVVNAAYAGRGHARSGGGTVERISAH
jgi:hypothetical protein